ncbi:MAG: transcriptional repressor LexA [Candidatus Kerfeldbacteria bacterium]|jgi:repressor LexA
MVTILPNKKQKIFQFLKGYIKENNYAPTLTEIAKEFNLSSLATVHEHIKFLEEHNFIQRDKDTARGITIIEDEIESSPVSDNNSILLPVVGLITAGEPIEALENRDSKIPVPKEMIGQKNSYILKVKGDSMIESLIADGDYVVCEKTEYAKNGDTVVALLEDGSATLKKFFRTKNFIRLQPANKKYKPRYEKNIIVQGRVLGIIRNFS